MKKVTVSADALRQVLNALNGRGTHLINELLATRGPLVGDTNPINILCDDYTVAVADQIDHEARIQQLEAKLKREDEALMEISATLEDLKSYGFTCETGPLEHCIPFNAIAAKAREALNGKP